MNEQHKKQAGFSAVELLITLFIAVALVGSGYQLYSIILRDSGETRKLSYASNVGYKILRQYTPQATASCAPITVSPQPAMPSDNELSNASIAVTMSCPYGTGSQITKVEVVVSYDSPQKEVVHAAYTSPN